MDTQEKIRGKKRKTRIFSKFLSRCKIRVYDVFLKMTPKFLTSTSCVSRPTGARTSGKQPSRPPVPLSRTRRPERDRRTTKAERAEPRKSRPKSKTLISAPLIQKPLFSKDLIFGALFNRRRCDRNTPKRPKFSNTFRRPWISKKGTPRAETRVRVGRRQQKVHNFSLFRKTVNFNLCLHYVILKANSEEKRRGFALPVLPRFSSSFTLFVYQDSSFQISTRTFILSVNEPAGWTKH